MKSRIEFPDSRGTYIIVFNLKKERKIQTKRRVFLLPEATYGYIGSAFGSGGLNSRLNRHLKKRKKKHWHFDYVSTSRFFTPVAVYCFLEKRIECEIAERFKGVFSAISGFGCSDCSCVSHLFIVNSLSEIDKIVSDLPFIVFKFRG
ncbi:DUF123 domain-containing protein [Desulfurobacterium sp.]|uniref:GIY-YIG nuclease family protein n=1 Tax=Desulfurobacterium sp. TaxID=2004706 RepID=UPI002604D9AD|nr:DUF123 domain-containing protein [Desulfurobacterium sp.]